MFYPFGAEPSNARRFSRLTSRGAPKPKPLVWLAQMVVDGDVPRRTARGNHHGVPDEVLEAAATGEA